MALFSFIAGVLAGVAASYVAAPLWRSASTLAHGRRRYLLAGAFVASFALIAGVIYLALGSRHSLERPTSSATASTSTAPADSATAAAMAAAEGAKPLSMNGYKVPLVKTAVKRALLDAVGNRYWEEA